MVGKQVRNHLEGSWKCNLKSPQDTITRGIPKLTCKSHLPEDQVTSWNSGSCRVLENNKLHRRVWWPIG